MAHTPHFFSWCHVPAGEKGLLWQIWKAVKVAKYRTADCDIHRLHGWQPKVAMHCDLTSLTTYIWAWAEPGSDSLEPGLLASMPGRTGSL